VLQFDRKAIVQIGKIKGAGLEIKNLRMKFDIKKTSTDDFNECKIDIYNMSESTRGKLKDLDEILVVKAGYEEAGNEQVIFVGNITMINNSFEQRPDVITTIEAKDGATTMRQLRVSVSYKAGTKAKTVLQGILKKSGMSLKHFDMTTVENKEYVNGFSFVGMGKVLLSRVCTYLGLEWSIQNDEIQLLKTGLSDQTKIIQLSSSSGLIGSPQRIEDISKNSQKTKAIKGWKITSLLMPCIEPGSLLFVQSREIPVGASFRVIELIHHGDTHGDEWTTETTAVLI
jgi:hypothetical protein